MRRRKKERVGFAFPLALVLMLGAVAQAGTSCKNTPCHFGDVSTSCGQQDAFWRLFLAGPEPTVSPITVRPVSAGTSHNCVSLSSGGVRCWGSATNGVLGYGNTTSVGDGVGPSIIAAGDVQFGGGNVTELEAGGQHTCVRFDTGSIRCWGDNGLGQLGRDNTTHVGDGSGPSVADAGDINVGGTVTQVSAGNGHTCALLSTGAVRCWGNGARGRLGYNSISGVSEGTQTILAAGDVAVGASVQWIEAGGNHTCALLTGGAVRCWGRGTEGQLGHNAASDIGNGGTTIIAAGDIPLGGTAVQLALGLDYSCALLTTGSVRCWGANGSGQLGYNSVTNVGSGGTSILVAGDVPLGGTAVWIAAQWNTTCAVLSTGAVRCWGSGTSGQLGHDNASNIGDGIGPTIVSGGDIPIGEPASKVTVGGDFVCAALQNGSVRCWGNGANGRLGYNSTGSVGNGGGTTIQQAGNVPLP